MQRAAPAAVVDAADAYLSYNAVRQPSLSSQSRLTSSLQRADQAAVVDAADAYLSYNAVCISSRRVIMLFSTDL